MGIHSNKRISKVEIKSFLGKNDLVWNLNPDVNILSGVNGSGKGTLLSIINCPEESLHFDVQKALIGNLLSISPNKQLVISTYSPAVIINGWHNKVSNMHDLYVKDLVISKGEPTKNKFNIIGGW